MLYLGKLSNIRHIAPWLDMVPKCGCGWKLAGSGARFAAIVIAIAAIVMFTIVSTSYSVFIRSRAQLSIVYPYLS